MDYDAGDEIDQMIVQTKPAYNPSAWRTHENNGKQCSQGSEFCYLCTHRPGEMQVDDNNEVIQDSYTALVNIIKTLAGEKTELAVIVNAVYNMYREDIQDEVSYRHPITNIVVHKPKWSKSSIERHILYSGICPELHDDIVDHIFHNIIDNHNQHMINMDTERVVEEERVAFMDTMKNYTNWKKFRFTTSGKLKLANAK